MSARLQGHSNGEFERQMQAIGSSKRFGGELDVECFVYTRQWSICRRVLLSYPVPQSFFLSPLSSAEHTNLICALARSTPVGRVASAFPSSPSSIADDRQARMRNKSRSPQLGRLSGYISSFSSLLDTRHATPALTPPDAFHRVVFRDRPASTVASTLSLPDACT